MTDDKIDNPWAPPVPVEEETPYVVKTNLSTLYRVLHFMLLTWTVPMFLFFLLVPFLFFWNTRYGGLACTIAFPFVAAYIGMIFHKLWAFVLCAIYAFFLVASPILSGEEGLRLYMSRTSYGVPILVLSLILIAMTLKRKLHKHHVTLPLQGGDDY